MKTVVELGHLQCQVHNGGEDEDDRCKVKEIDQMSALACWIRCEQRYVSCEREVYTIVSIYNTCALSGELNPT